MQTCISFKLVALVLDWDHGNEHLLSLIWDVYITDPITSHAHCENQAVSRLPEIFNLTTFEKTS